MSPRDDTDDDKTFKHRSLLVPILNKLSNKSYTEPLYGYLCIYICIYKYIYLYNKPKYFSCPSSLQKITLTLHYFITDLCLYQLLLTVLKMVPVVENISTQIEQFSLRFLLPSSSNEFLYFFSLILLKLRSGI